MARMRSEEVMVKLWLDQENIVDLQTFAYEFDPEIRTFCSDAEWVSDHFSQCLNGSDIYDLLGIKEKGVYQILMKVTIRGFYSGWEIAEYDEELDVKEFQFKKMPDDWFSTLEDDELVLCENKFQIMSASDDRLLAVNFQSEEHANEWLSRQEPKLDLCNFKVKEQGDIPEGFDGFYADWMERLQSRNRMGR